MTTSRCENGGALDAFRTLLEMGWGNVDSAAFVREGGNAPTSPKAGEMGHPQNCFRQNNVDYLLIGR